MRPVVRWFGGKYVLADWIISYFPEHRVYVEPFGGAASVLLRKKRSYAEIYNDLDKGIVTLFRVLQNEKQAEELKRLLELTPFAREEFELAHDLTCENEIEFSRRMIIRSFMGFGADSTSNPKKATGFRANANRSGTTPAHDWANYSPSIPEFTERLKGVVIENRDAFKVMESHDGPDTLHFIDPPYVHETRGHRHGYNFEMTDDDHLKLIEFIKSLQGMVILCGYPNKIYESLDWAFVDKKTYADGARERTERLWVSPNAQAAGAQMEFKVS